MIYLASPYSHPDPAIRQQRFESACATAAALLLDGHLVFSPIVHGHQFQKHGVPGDWTFWERDCRWHLERCDEVVVLMADGWKESKGVQAEIAIATELEKVVWYRFPVGPTTPTLAPGATGGGAW